MTELIMKYWIKQNWKQWQLKYDVCTNFIHLFSNPKLRWIITSKVYVYTCRCVYLILLKQKYKKNNKHNQNINNSSNTNRFKLLMVLVVVVSSLLWTMATMILYVYKTFCEGVTCPDPPTAMLVGTHPFDSHVLMYILNHCF